MDQRDHDYARHAVKQGDTVVFAVSRDAQCDRCGSAVPAGGLLLLAGDKASCLKCAGLGELELLPSGDTALTRRASKHSARRAIVVQWSRVGKHYERRGTLLEPAAIGRARVECQADAAAREAKQQKAAAKREVEEKQYLAAFTSEVKRLFPSCPEAEAAEIAVHACEKYSGRVGRSASAKELDEEKVRLAVIAHIRHVHTGYDGFFDLNVRKHDARRLVQAKIERVLGAWQTPRENDQCKMPNEALSGNG